MDTWVGGSGPSQVRSGGEDSGGKVQDRPKAEHGVIPKSQDMGKKRQQKQYGGDGSHEASATDSYWV